MLTTHTPLSSLLPRLPLRPAVLLLLLLPSWLIGQDCQLTLSGKVLDEGTSTPLAFANVWLEEATSGAVTDEEGLFRVAGLCAGEYHVEISHIGCHAAHLYLVLTKDTTLQITMAHHTEFLAQVIVEAESDAQTGVNRQALGRKELERGGGQTLAALVSSIAGVTTLQNGSGIAKPVIHGLTGNRIAILNNGLLQAGQQWGNDHAPEIDPFTADRLRVIKGVETIAYGGNTLGGAVLVEPGHIPDDPHLHGAAQYVFGSNGRVHTASARLEQSRPWANWRLTGTFKHGGDHRAPDYWLRNTGVRERNAALQLQKQVGDQWFHHLYASYFHTNLGVLRGSHIGNLTDLTQAFVREVPFFTSNEYRNDLSSPRQLVTHSLLKYNSSYYPQPDKAWHFTYGGQLNRRQEFDVRRGDRSDIPALDLQLISHFVEIRRTVESRPTHTQSGLQYRFSGNSNQPGTGILPLIPDYNQHQAGIYHIWSNNQGSWHWQTGLRYDLLAMNVWSISQDLPRRIIRRDHLFHRASWGSGIERETGKWGVFRLNTGITTRAPEVNELYSAGLHQGVSGIEEGNPQLKQEASLKTIVSQTFNWRSRWFIEASLYAQWVQNFIYLQPQDDFRLTIRGAFPVYLYEQAHARITGADITAKYVFNDHLSWLNRWAIVRGWNRAADIPLPLMPPDQLNSTFTWTLAGNERWEAPEISITGSYTLEQTRLLATQDFAPPPGSYLLWGATVHTALKLGHNTLHLGLQGSNLLNRRYRNYLNRLRYYADEEGTDVRMNVRVEF